MYLGLDCAFRHSNAFILHPLMLRIIDGSDFQSKLWKPNLNDIKMNSVGRDIFLNSHQGLKTAGQLPTSSSLFLPRMAHYLLCALEE